MITPKVIGSKVIFGPCRLSYTHLFTKYSPDNDPANGKYQTNVIIPKSEKETIKALRQAIEAAKQDGIVSAWGGKEPKKLALPLNDGDDKDDELYEDTFFVNAKSSTRPGIVDKNRAPIVDEEEIYSGIWAVVSVSFFPYSVSGNNGIACGLNNVMKYKDDAKLGGRVSAQTDFDGVQVDEDEDL